MKCHEVAAVAPGLAAAEQLPGYRETIPVESGTEPIAHDNNYDRHIRGVPGPTSTKGPAFSAHGA
jgi:hypothetical protein